MKNKLILSISIVLIILSLLLCIKTAADKREINKYKQGQFSYADFGNGIVELTMASGEVVRLCFDKNSVKAEQGQAILRHHRRTVAAPSGRFQQLCR